MNRNQIISLAWLSSAGIPADTLQHLLAEEPDPEQLLARFRREGERPFREEIPQSALRLLTNHAEKGMLETWGRMIDRFDINAVTCTEDPYPSRLRGMPEAPAILFYQGTLSALDQPTVSMVGSRNASTKGTEACWKIAEELSRNGIAVISGLAYGIDAAAHQGCLKGKSPTIAVLGCGLDQEYPADHAGLRRQIIERGGLVLSEYTPGEKPLGWHFPWRNRIISGLGDCLAVMEARIRSGSMTTVQHALNQGKDIFVYPGEPGSLRSEGNHQLLREGAIYFTCAADLMEDMNWLDKTAEVEQNTVLRAEDRPDASPAEKQVLLALDRGELSFDQLCEKLNMNAALLSATLSMMQISGLIRALPGKRYEKKQG